VENPVCLWVRLAMSQRLVSVFDVHMYWTFDVCMEVYWHTPMRKAHVPRCRCRYAVTS